MHRSRKLFRIWHSGNQCRRIRFGTRPTLQVHLY